MHYNLSENLLYCQEFVESIIGLISYSHGVPIIASLLISTFIYLQDRGLLLGRILLGLSLTIAIWAYLNFTIWTSYATGGLVMYAWAPIESFNLVIFLLAFYFIYVFIEQHDISFTWKVIALTTLVPSIILAPTELNLVNYDIQECIATEGNIYATYGRTLQLLLAAAIIIFPIYRFFISKNQTEYIRNNRAQGLLLTLGTAIFVYTFMGAGYISEQTLDFRYELYGLFGIIIFVGILSYLIVKYQTFNVRIIAAQVLVAALILSVGSQFLFVKNPVSIVLSGVTLVFIVAFGALLIRSVKREIAQREEIEKLAKDLAKANARLRKLDQLKSEFVSIASHQLRSPLTSIRGYASMILEGSYGKLTKKAAEAISRIQASSRYMALTVEDFLNVSRIESGTMKYATSDFDICEVVKTVYEDIKPAVTEKRLDFTFTSNVTGVCTVHADIGKVRQIIQNLVDNATKYTPQGKIDIILNEVKAKKQVEIIIKDTGIGMAPETLHEIFHKFARAKNANTVNVIGSGLGLYVAKEMAEKMGGSIKAESEGEGKGSTFTIHLPLAGTITKSSK